MEQPVQGKRRGGTDTSKFSVAVSNFTEKNPPEGKNTLKTQSREANGLMHPCDDKFVTCAPLEGLVMGKQAGQREARDVIHGWTPDCGSQTTWRREVSEQGGYERQSAAEKRASCLTLSVKIPHWAIVGTCSQQSPRLVVLGFRHEPDNASLDTVSPRKSSCQQHPGHSAASLCAALSSAGCPETGFG